MSPDASAGTFSRRAFIERMGAGAGALAAGMFFAPPARSQFALTSPVVFGRMFPDLATGQPGQRPRARRAARHRQGPRHPRRRRRPGRGPGRADRRPGAEPEQPEQPDPHRGHDVPRPVPRPRHDVRRDVAARRRRPSPSTTANARTPALDLDSVYGGGPIGVAAALRPAPTGPSSGSRAAACSRTCRATRDGAAIIADPRNDENLIIAGLQARVPPVPQPRGRPCVRARRRAGWTVARVRRGAAAHHLALPVDDPPRVPAAVRRARRWSTTSCARPPLLPAGVGQAFMPVEFQGAAYRFGHSMVRPSYRANLAGDNGAAVLRDDLRPRRRGSAPTRSTCAAAPARRGASSAGRRSSTSATARCGRTS